MKTLVDLEIRPMTREESEWFVKLTLITTDIPLDEVLDIPICKLIHNRFPKEFEVDSKLILFLSELSKGIPGNGVMLAFTIFKNNIHRFDALTNIFPDGFPTDEAYHLYWLSQKVDDGQRTYNLLDQPDTWKK